MALNKSLVDVFLSSISQIQSKRSGPLGRLLSAKNTVVRQYDPGAQPQRISLKQRNGFTARTTDLRLAVDGTTEAPQWDNPELLTSLDEQLVSICNSRPRVWNGTSWSYYPDTRAVTNKLTQRVLHTSNHTVQAPSSQTIEGITCDVWTETTLVNSLPITGAYISISAPDGAWVRTPQLLYQDASGRRTLAKVVADPVLQRFWVFLDKVGVGGEKISVHLYNLNGAEIATPLEIVRNDTFTPGYWDVTYLNSGNVSYFVNAAATGTEYAGAGAWVFPEGALLPTTAGGQLTISGNPYPNLNGTFDLQGATDATHVSTTQTPTPSYSVPGNVSNLYDGSGFWTFATSTLDIPVGGNVVISGSAVPAFDGVYTVDTWNNTSKIALLLPAVAHAGAAIGATATIVVTPPPTPPPLTGCKLWLKGDVGVTTGGGTVSVWADQSGNGNDLIQASSPDQPAYNSSGFTPGIPSVDFSTVDTVMMENTGFSWGANWSVTVVYQLQALFTSGRLVDWLYPTVNREVGTGGGTPFFSDNGTTTVTGGTFAANQTTNLCVTLGSGTTSIYTTDLTTAVQSAALTETNTTGIRIGALPGTGQASNARISEVLVHDHALSLAERQQLQAYLESRGYYGAYTPVPGPLALTGDTIAIEYPADGRVVLIQPTDGTGAADGVDFSTFTYDGVSTITEARVSDPSVHTCGPVSWVTDDLGDHLGYFATVDGGETPLVWGYQATGNGQSHEFDLAIGVNDYHYVDSLIGWAEVGANPNQPSLNVGITYLSDGSSSDAGPAHDPAFRTITVWNCDFANTVTFGKQINSVVPVSRAFLHDGEYHAFTYYQSGSGLTFTPDSQTVSNTTGDYMTGAAVQPIQAMAGDQTQGGSASVTGPSVFVSASMASTVLTAGDKVELYAIVAGDVLNSSPNNMPVGAYVLKWTIQATTNGVGYNYARLSIAGASEPSADGAWWILSADNPTSGHVIYTNLQNNSGGTVTPANLTSGSVEILATAVYRIPSLPDFIDPATIPEISGGSIVVTGDSVTGNNVTAGIVKYGLSTSTDVNSGYYILPANELPYVLVMLSSQGLSYHGFNATVSPLLPFHWFFGNGTFDSSFVGANLVIEDATGASETPPSDLGTFEITASSGGHEITTSGSDAAATIAHVWQSPPYPAVSIQLPIGTAGIFKLQALTLDFSYQDATIIVQGDVQAPANNGAYQVYFVDVTNGLLYATPVYSTQLPVNQNFLGVETITVIKANAVVAPWQPTFFMSPLTGTQPMVGKFDSGVAYADWRLEGDSVLGPNEFPLALASVNVTDAGLQFSLPYRAQNVTSNLPVATIRGQINLAGSSIIANTVGLKTWKLSNDTGTPALTSGELLLPGPMAGEFTLSGFTEDGINLGFEQPYLKAQSVATSGQLALTVGAVYQYTAVGEYSDENGNRIFTPPSPVLNVHLNGANNVITLQGRAMNPIGFDGVLIEGEVGTSCRLVGISIYRNAIEGVGADAQPTVDRYKITNDLAINGLAPTSSLNSSGFSFPDDLTWQYVDQNPDVTILGAEQLYTDKGYLPRYGAPAFTFGIGSWKNRTWVIASDGSIWMSGEKTEGDAVWFHPAFRYVLPTDDRPVSMGVLEDNLIVFCEGGSVFQIPASVFPDATGRNGTLPTPIQLPFNVVCTGHAVSLRSAVAFSSDARGSSVWAITRDLKLVWLSQPIQDALLDSITGLTVDADQLLHVCTGSDQWFVYDQVVDVWTEYALPTAALLATTTNGLVAFQDANRVFVYDPTSWSDYDGTTRYGCPPDVTLADVNFGTVRGLKSVWELQLIGTYKGPHRQNIEVSYPDEYQEPTTTFDPFIPDPDAPYIVPFNPMVEEAAAYGIRFYADFVGVDSPGDSFEIELITAEVGVDHKTGATKLPDSQTATASDE